LTSAINQFFKVITLFQAGIGGVTMASLYKPLAEKNRQEISVIVKTTELFLRKISLIFVIFSIIFSLLYPYLINIAFDRWFTTVLILVMSISTFAQYFFGQTYVFLLKSDQKQWLISLISIAKTIINTILAVILIKFGYGIIAVKAGSAVVFALSSFLLYIYAKSKYEIVNTVHSDNLKLEHRWDNFGQQVSQFVCQNTDLIILSVFSNVYEISVYTVYAMILHGLYGFFTPLVSSFESAFGNMFAKNQLSLIGKNLKIYESILYSTSTFLYGCGAAMIIPFIDLYTKGVTDIDYSRPIFAYIFIVSSLFQCYRLPYSNLTHALGHFRQTRNPSFIEAGINIALSIYLVSKMGIVGVIIGTLVSYMYRTFMYAFYVARIIIKRSPLIFIKRILLSLISVSIIAAVPLIKESWTTHENVENYLEWIVSAIPIAILALLIVLANELIFYRNDFIDTLRLIIKAVSNKRD
jgi:O-antigen/teichoic acid export membrane protein